MVLEELEEPNDPYGLNHHWPAGDALGIFLVSIPYLGIGVLIGPLAWYFERREHNNFNMAEVARKTFLFGVKIQLLYILIGLVVMVL